MTYTNLATFYTLWRKQEHAKEMAARKARRAERPGGSYDRATARSVIRSVRRKMAGRWDGRMVIP